MTEYKTFPGKVYTVTCAEDSTVVLPHPLGVGEVVLECQANQQLHVTATAGSLFTSSDSAIVTEVFKLAPRRKLALLQGVAGGWLPMGFTELEWLESSGTQLIKTGVELTDDTGIKASAVATAKGTNNYIYGIADFKGNGGGVAARQQTNTVVTLQLGNPVEEKYFDVNLGDFFDVETVGMHTCTVNGVSKYADVQEPWQPPTPLQIAVFAYSNNYGSSQQYNHLGSYKLYSFSIWNGEEKQRDFVPVLDAEGNPSLYDRVSKTCFYNDGSGSFGYRVKATGSDFAPMSLRDPYYTAPSGVWARAAGENALEIIADTEAVSGEDWLHFANTSEAYEYFGITQEEIL